MPHCWRFWLLLVWLPVVKLHSVNEQILSFAVLGTCIQTSIMSILVCCWKQYRKLGAI
jgi:hypothetical protein